MAAVSACGAVTHVGHCLRPGDRRVTRMWPPKCHYGTRRRKDAVAIIVCSGLGRC